jgi:hypothetical protein
MIERHAATAAAANQRADRMEKRYDPAVYA